MQWQSSGWVPSSTPAWVQSSAAQLSQVSWSRTTRFRVFFAILALSFVYTLSTFLWENDDSSEWEDGAIPISYVDKNWEPYTPAEQLEDDPSAYSEHAFIRGANQINRRPLHLLPAQ